MLGTPSSSPASYTRAVDLGGSADREKVVGRHRRILSAKNQGAPAEANGKDLKRTVSLLPTAPTYGGSDLEVYSSSSSNVAVLSQSLRAGAGRRPDRVVGCRQPAHHDDLLCLFRDECRTRAYRIQLGELLDSRPSGER